MPIIACDEAGKGDVCSVEAARWRTCVTDTFANGKATKSQQGLNACTAPREAFDVCATAWRDTVGPDVRLRGAHPGEPPPQCMSMACAFENCMARTTYDQSKCSGAMQQLKHCVKALYGKEYVDFE